jgi:pimeloyl-ACP methyl ester carboxylesterase
MVTHLLLSSTPDDSVAENNKKLQRSQRERVRQKTSRGFQFVKQKTIAAKSEARRKLKSYENDYPFLTGKIKKAWTPVLVALVLGYRLGARTRKIVTDTSGTVIRRRPFVSQIALTIFVVREMWRTIPPWMKKQLPIARKQSVVPGLEAVVDESDLSSIPVLMGRLQTLLKASTAKLSSPLSAGEIQTSFLTLLRLSAQMKVQDPYERDMVYEESGTLLTADERAQFTDIEETFELADIAYNELPFDQELRDVLGSRNYSLVRHEPLSLPGSAAHFVALSTEQKVIVIGVKGTSNFEDFLTDACGNVVNHTLSAPFIKGGPVEIRCHEGVFVAASRLFNDLERLVEALFIPTGYKITVTGHSLGAGVASLLAILLLSRFPDLRAEGRLKVIAIAPPPILDLDASLACQPFTTTLVNNADIIPRTSLSNLIITMEFLKLVNNKLDKSGLKPAGLNATAAFLKSFTEGINGTMIMPPQEIKNGWKTSIELVGLDDPDHLFVPGRVLHMYDLWSKPGYGLTHNSSLPEPADGLLLDSIVHPAERVLVTDGTSPVLRTIEMDGRMLSDHMAPAYRSSIRTLFGAKSD